MRKKMIGILCCMLLIVPLLTVTARQNESMPVVILLAPLDQNITIVDFSFNPNNVTVPIGTKVVWTNNGPSEHTVTSDNAVFNSGTIAVGHKWNFTFNVTGSYPYHCSFHASMHGIVIVTGGVNLPPNKPTIDGPTSGKINTILNFTAVTTDPDGDNVQYYFNWGDGTNTGWTPFVASGTISHQSHTWTKKGTYFLSVNARDTSLAESPVATLIITMPVETLYSFYSNHMIVLWFLNKLVYMFPLLREFIRV
jgi:plastocyanin